MGSERKQFKSVRHWFCLTPQGWPIPYSCRISKRAAMEAAARGTGRNCVVRLKRDGFTAAFLEVRKPPKPRKDRHARD